MQKIRYKELLDISSAWIWALDINSVLTYCSENSLLYVGYTREELIGTSPFKYMDTKEIKKIYLTFKEAIKYKTNIINLEHNFVCKDGSTITVVANAIPILDEEGEVLCFQGTSRDITQEKETDKFLKNLNASLKEKVQSQHDLNKEKEQQLIQQSRLAQMGEMISMIAHQWRQPLGAISATAINMQLKIELDSYDLSQKQNTKAYQDYIYSELSNINEYVQTLTTTIDDFRYFYKPNKQVVSTKLDTICTKSLNIIKASLMNENINIIREYNSNETVKMYKNEMMQVVLNILQNAHDNFKEKNIKDPYILIKTEGKVLSIFDNGGGIPQDILDKVFDPYFSTKKNKNGTGLGLYMSKTIVEEHHNGILMAKNVNNGVCFTITLF